MRLPGRLPPPVEKVGLATATSHVEQDFGRRGLAIASAVLVSILAVIGRLKTGPSGLRSWVRARSLQKLVLRAPRRSRGSPRWPLPGSGAWSRNCRRHPDRLGQRG